MSTYRITSLYPQYQRGKDRRQQNIPVAVERRSGQDRRSQDRVLLDSKLTRDIFEVKSQVAKLESLSPKLFTDRVTTQNPNFSSQNNFTQDQLLKQTKPDYSEIARQEAKLQDKASTSFQVGVISAALAGAIAVSFMGTTGAVIAVGTCIYVGARVLKTLMAKQIDDKDKDIKND
ncbi:MAG: hypothetical protein LUG16_07190 [Candidatus Gastranaerophilales bacterium]|nr:hypothetical protein [Candidatus Gastranaerophilales bacterium]